MELPKRAQKLEWNLNTIIQLVTLFGMCVGGVTIWVNKGRDIEELQKWRSAMEARSEERFRALESEVRKIDNLAYRVASTEQSSTSTAAAIKDLQTLVSQQSGDLKVIKEILQRVEGGQLRR
ncbi:MULTISPECIES: hypothetical protein [unclassified Ensifer]|nr:MULTISPECIES: hypothetical protein [unclassified Ensifer]KRD56463.1 hypothetical protein ASE60_08360 [Ensifer sp. Root278]